MRCGTMILLVFVSVAAAASTRMQADVSGFGAARLASRGPDQGADPFRVSVRAAWRGEPDAELTRGAVRELAEVWTENGVHVGRYAEELSSEPHAAATVTLMLAQAPGPAVPGGALGWIEFLQDARPLPVLHVSVPAARAVVEAAAFYRTPGLQLPRDLRQRLMARVLGRAAAHELGHYLLASRQHSASGLMRTRFMSEQWVGDERTPFRLRPAERAMLGARLRALTRTSRASQTVGWRPDRSVLNQPRHWQVEGNVPTRTTHVAETVRLH